MLDASFLQSIYATLSIFAVMVIGLEVLGFGGDHDGGGHHGGGDAGDVGGDGMPDAFDGDVDAVDLLTADTREGRRKGALVRAAEQKRSRSALSRVLKALSVLRNFLYFSAGFGPMGLLAMWQGESALSSLVWAVPAGLVVLGCVRAVLKFQRNEFDSSIAEADFIGQEGTVIIAIHPGETGRVRITFPQMVRERYARSVGDDVFPKGARVKIIGLKSADVVVTSCESLDKPSQV